MAKKPAKRQDNGANTGSADGRDAVTGRFVKGKPGGPGRPSLRGERLYMAVFAEELDTERLRKICRQGFERAEAGDDSAREWVSKYAFGPPGKFSLAELLVAPQEGPVNPRAVLEDLCRHPDPATRLRAATTLWEQQSAVDQLDKFLLACDEAAKLSDMQKPSGPNPWQPEGEE